jgi:hypothetical protein
VVIAGLTVATTATAPVPTAIAAGTGGVVQGQGGRCQMPAPPGFQVGADGDNFRGNDIGFGVVAEEANYTETAIFAAQGFYNRLVQSAIYTDVVLTGSSNESDRARRDFTGLLGTTSIQGTIFARTFGTTACAVTVITYQGAAMPHAQRRRR